MVDARELGMRPHSYRNFSPEEFLTAVQDGEPRDELRGALSRVESGRFEPALEAASRFFNRLDADEQATFLRRNPGYVRWIHVWERLDEFAGYPPLYDQAGELLAMGEWNVPPFERRDVPDDRTILADLVRRRRSYRNFTPGELMEVARRQHEVSRGRAREIGLRTPEIRERLAFPAEFSGKEIVREIFKRIEDGRFEPVLAATQRMFRALDGDERRAFARANPGLMEWVNVWGFSEDVGEFDLPIGPTVADDDNAASGNPCSITPEGREVADDIAEQLDRGPVQWRDHGLEVIGKGESRTVVVPLGEGILEGDCVIKFEPGEPEQNRAEMANWEAAPPGVREVLAPIEASASDQSWLVMPRAGQQGQPMDLLKIESVLDDHGWSCRGLHPENIGVFDGQPKAIDYGFPCMVDGESVRFSG